jgi:hypothetical protein
MESNVMKSASIKSAFVAGIIKSVSAVRENENGYRFITVVNGNRASNIYLGQKSANQVEEGDILTKEQMLGAEFVLATNDATRGSEQRIKLSLAGASDYTNLANIFDDVTVTADHSAEVLKALKAEMLTREESEALEEEDEDEDEDAKALAEAKAIREAKKAEKARLLAEKK